MTPQLVPKDPRPLLMMSWQGSDPHPVGVCSPGRHVFVCRDNNHGFELRKNVPSFLCHGVIQTKEKAAWMTQFYFLSLGSCNLCLPVYCQCHKRPRAFDFVWDGGKNTKCFFSTQLSFHDWWSSLEDRSGSVLFVPWPISVSDLCDTLWHGLTHTCTHTCSQFTVKC